MDTLPAGDHLSRRMSTNFQADQASTTGSVRKSRNTNAMYLGTSLTKAANRLRTQSRGREGSMSEMSEFRAAPPVALEPTYKMEPDKEVCSGPLQRRMQETMEGLLEQAKYDQETAPGLSVTVSNALRMDLKNVESTRYKLICHVTLGQKGGQHMALASRCIWNDKFDTFASVTYQNKSLFAVATVYAVFYE